jgi:putative ABC transport system substrate-binding protein
MMQVIDLLGKRKPRFSLSEEQKVPLGLFAILSELIKGGPKVKRAAVIGVVVVAICGFLVPFAYAESYTVSVNQIVEHPALDAVRKGFQDSLEKQGFEVKYNVHIAQGNISTANQIARQILGEKPDLVLGIATPTSQACAQVIKNIPILITAVTDPVGAGLVESLEKPGGNVTGMTDMSPVDRQVELIKEFIPDIKKLGIIYNSGEANSVSILKVLKDVSGKMGIEVVEATVANSGGVTQAAKSLVGRADAIYIPTDNTVVSVFEAITKVSVEKDLPLFAADVDSVSRGAIAALAIDYYRMGLQSGEMAARILKGGDTATMPVEALEDLMVYVNPKSAADMGIVVPESVMKRADKVIE